MKRFDIVEIHKSTDIYNLKKGVIVSIKKGTRILEYCVCFGVDKWDNGIIGFFDLCNLKVIKR